MRAAPSVTQRVIADISAGPCRAILGPLGFRRAAPHFWRATGGLVQCVNFQASAFGSRDAGSFTLNLGVTSPALWEGYVGRPLPARPASALWPVNVRLGQLTPSRLDRWWTVTADTEAAPMGEEVAALLRAHAVPWLDALATRDALVRAVHENPQALGLFRAHIPVVQAILALEDGDSRRATALLRDAIDATRPRPGDGLLRTVAARLGLVIETPELG